jgi:2-dehydro-3-deoxyphosphogluconate aldolase/(4S)-4-hydroxy-2-oxoglutarate aldolase
MPTGGVRLDKVAEYAAQPNVVAVGGTWIVPPALLEAGDFAAIEKLAREAFEAAKKQ